MQRKEISCSKDEINLKKKREHKSGNSKKKRSISVQEKSELIEYYLNQKVSEYSQQSLQPKECEHVQQNEQVLPILQKNESPKKQIVSKAQLNIELKKQLNLLGIGEEQEPLENNQTNNEFPQRPFSSKYLVRNNRDSSNFYNNRKSKNELEIKDCKSTSRMNNRHYFHMESSSTYNSTNCDVAKNNLKSQKGFGFLTTSNTYFLSNSFAKRENFILNRGSSLQNRFGLDINCQEQPKNLQNNNNKKRFSNNQSSEQFKQIQAQGDETSKSILINKHKDYQLQNQTQSLENSNNQKSKDDTQKSQLKVKEETFSSYLINLPIHHSKKQPFQVNIGEKRISKTNCQQQVSDYINFQNKMLNGLMPKPTQEEQNLIESQKEKEGLLKYFDFPQSLNLQESQMNKLEQSKQVFQAYLSQRSPKQVAEKMKDYSLLSVLQKVKSQYMTTSNRQSKSPSKNSNSPFSGHNTPNNLQIIEGLKEILQDSSKENLKIIVNQQKVEQQNNQVDSLRAYFGKERYSKQPKLLSDLINQLFKESELQGKEKNDQTNLCQVIQDSYQAHFLFKRSKSVDRGSIIKQQKKEQFNHQFNLEMQKLREKEKKLQMNDQKLPPNNIQNKLKHYLLQDIFIQNSSSIDNVDNLSKVVDINKQIEQAKVVLPNSNKFVKRSNTNIKQRKKNSQTNIQQGNSIANLPILDCRIIQSSKIKTRIPTAFRDLHINSVENKQTNDTQEQLELQEQQNNLKELIDSFNSECLFSDSSKENLLKQDRRIKKKKKKTRNSSNSINQLIIINNYNTKQSVNQLSKKKQDNLNNSYDSYKPSSNHLINNKKAFQKSKKFFQNQILHLNESQSKSPQKQQFNLQIDPNYLKAQNLKYKMLRQLIQSKQNEIQV
ncbi:hypothetical protein TTHERM_00647290 (macronuclear) [Tetrahymena thermophila SB210]|uniref:Uncharacterized protein n=1 Tax=Tetrahymena thermophila (strain SB210) TaxID=312017 RepID=I7MJU0_TETTS|nr:hypothetical protein TTHERM_00647290 [Tetrahymena thermophila SB210]EAS07196.1 hypothetical protein TTHERM_00647290 [Tetrahymena thermophila SB210]|eukprot:XP_001027438.1 hypothetical protein TTHERM_00647290 [Tetrahymena thermophila SB210]